MRKYEQEYDRTLYLNHFFTSFLLLSLFTEFLADFTFFSTYAVIIHLMSSQWYLSSKNKQWCNRGGNCTFQSSNEIIVLSFQRDIKCWCNSRENCQLTSLSEEWEWSKRRRSIKKKIQWVPTLLSPTHTHTHNFTYSLKLRFSNMLT